MDNRILKARGTNGGTVEGEAMVCPNSIQGWSSLDMHTGVIIEKDHIHEGKSIQGKILVIPCSRGSLGWSDYFCGAAIHGTGPIAYVVTKMDSKVATTVATADVPCVSDFPAGCDPCIEIHTGDYIRVDGKAGTVEIIKPYDKE